MPVYLYFLSVLKFSIRFEKVDLFLTTNFQDSISILDGTCKFVAPLEMDTFFLKIPEKR